MRFETKNGRICGLNPHIVRRCGSKNNGRIPHICHKITNSLITSSLHTFNPPPPLTPNDIDLERGNLIGQLEVYLAYVYCICFGPQYADFCICDHAESSLISAAYATAVQIPHYAKFSQMRGNSSPGTILRLCIIILYRKDQTKMYRICTYI